MTAGAPARLAAHTVAAVLSGRSGPGGPFDPAELARLDEAEEFPAAACAELDAAGLPDWYVPARFGGALAELPDVMAVMRATARRDLTVAIAHGKTFLGSVSVWVAGSADQAAALASAVRSGGIVSWGLTERDHGSDLMAGAVTATRHGDGWVLDGAKWLINNATRADLMCVLARTEPGGGPRGFSVFLADLRDPRPGTVRRTPKLRTHGIRGADISGVEFTGAAAVLVGDEGAGIEITLKALQLTRTTCTVLSLGAGDHAVAIAAEFLRERVLGRRRLSDVPRMRRVLGEAATGVLLAEAAAVVAARSAHTLPDELSVTSALVKAFVPTAVEQSIEQLAELMGTRGFLTADYRHGEFAKLERDHRIVGLFDGSTLVNRASLITQFPRLARRNALDVTTTVCLAEPLPTLDTARLVLVSRTGNAIVSGLSSALAELPAEFADLADALLRESGAVHAELARHRPVARAVPTAAFRLAERYELLFAAAAAVHVWVANPASRWERGCWLRACLTLALTRLGVPVDGADDAYEDVAAAVLAHGAVSLLDGGRA